MGLGGACGSAGAAVFARRTSRGAGKDMGNKFTEVFYSCLGLLSIYWFVKKVKPLPPEGGRGLTGIFRKERLVFHFLGVCKLTAAVAYQYNGANGHGGHRQNHLYGGHFLAYFQ